MTLTTHEIKAVALDIYVGGDLADAQRTCREYAKEFGVCITVEPLEIVYPQGQESGVRVAFKTYPRFPRTTCQIWEEATGLAKLLIERLFQSSAMICGPDKHVWITDNSKSVENIHAPRVYAEKQPA